MPTLIEEVEALRSQRREMDGELSRIGGRLEGVQEELTALEERCKAEFGCTVDELPALVSKQEAELAAASAAVSTEFSAIASELSKIGGSK